MTTAEKLEEIADTARFEIIAVRALRESKPGCAGIIHLGINAQGKTIRGPVDGFWLVPGSSPPHYIFAACATTARDKLEQKWLAIGSPRSKKKKRGTSNQETGDLIKAAEEAASLRPVDSTARFGVYLCTNRRLDNQLMQKVYATAKRLDVEVDFLEQSQLIQFLDSNPVGQWLRQEYLGIKADLLSRPLLEIISRSSLQEYPAKLLTPSEFTVSTSAAEAYKDLQRPNVSIHFLMGPSGAGKSVVAWELFRRHAEKQGIAIWIPALIVERSAFLTDAIRSVLQWLHPRLGETAGHEALTIATVEEPLVLVIDDINRSQNPTQLLTRVIGWSRSRGSQETDGPSPLSAIRIVCPVWDSLWRSEEIYYRSKSVGVHVIGPMRRQEAVACLRAATINTAVTLSASELHDLAAQMNDDPILLGLFGRILREGSSENPVAIAKDVIGQFIGGALRRMEHRHSVVAAEYESVAVLIATEMIRRKTLLPQWSEIESWFSGNPRCIQAIGHQVQDGSLCRLGGGLRQFEFRHDRIRAHFLALAAARLLESENSLSSVVDPFFVPFVAQALADRQFSVEVVSSIKRVLPAALVGAIPLLKDSGSPYSTLLVGHAHEWLRLIDQVLPSVRQDALSLLGASRGNLVLKATDGLRGDDLFWSARLRNGDALAGINLLYKTFDPALQNHSIEALLDEVSLHHMPTLRHPVNRNISIMFY